MLFPVRDHALSKGGSGRLIPCHPVANFQKRKTEMRKLFLLLFGLLALAVAATSNLSAQTVGGNGVTTYTWTGLSSSLASTVVFTPSVDTDVLLTFYASVNPSGNTGLCVFPQITYTDEYGYQTQYFVFGTTNQFVSAAGGSAITIHAMASTTVSLSVNDNACGTATGTYDVIVSRTTLNP